MIERAIERSLHREPDAQTELVGDARFAHADRVLFGSDGDPSREPEQFWTPHWRFLETDDEYFDHPAQMFSELGAPLQGRWKIHGVFLPDEVLRKMLETR